jgi:hypothetical protein
MASLMEKYYSSSEIRVLRFATVVDNVHWGWSASGKRTVQAKLRAHMLLSEQNNLQ